MSCNTETNFPDNDKVIEDEKFVQYGTPFAGVPEISDINMYEVNPLVFSQQRNLDGVRQRLDEIQDLGINVIWLMPIHPIGQEIGVSDRIPFFFGTNYRINWAQNPHILEEYKRILKFRAESNAVRKGVLENLGSTAAILSFKKIFQNEEVVVIVNTLGKDCEIQIPDSLKGSKWLNVLLDTEVVVENELALPAYSYLILKEI